MNEITYLLEHLALDYYRRYWIVAFVRHCSRLRHRNACDSNANLAFHCNANECRLRPWQANCPARTHSSPAARWFSAPIRSTDVPNAKYPIAIRPNAAIVNPNDFSRQMQADQTLLLASSSLAEYTFDGPNSRKKIHQKNSIQFDAMRCVHTVLLLQVSQRLLCDVVSSVLVAVVNLCVFFPFLSFWFRKNFLFDGRVRFFGRRLGQWWTIIILFSASRRLYYRYICNVITAEYFRLSQRSHRLVIVDVVVANEKMHAHSRSRCRREKKTEKSNIKLHKSKARIFYYEI